MIIVRGKGETTVDQRDQREVDSYLQEKEWKWGRGRWRWLREEMTKVTEMKRREWWQRLQLRWQLTSQLRLQNHNFFFSSLSMFVAFGVQSLSKCFFWGGGRCFEFSRLEIALDGSNLLNFNVIILHNMEYWILHIISCDTFQIIRDHATWAIGWIENNS